MTFELPEHYSPNRLVNSVTAAFISALAVDASLVGISHMAAQMPEWINTPVRAAFLTAAVALTTGAINYCTFDRKKNSPNGPSL